MNRVILCTAFIFIAASAIFAQTPTPTPFSETENIINSSGGPNLPQQNKQQPPLDSMLPGAATSWYVRPDKDKRLKRYVNGVVGPFALAKYAATAGITTWRNTPKEWGDKWDGFGHRFVSNLGKSAIKNTTIYGLDEALKVDSRFYRSRNRSVASRLRNSIFSPVTARNRKGERVIGIPRITASFASSVIASETWYPSRYNYRHGLKSGITSLGFNVGFNLIKEFVWKK